MENTDSILRYRSLLATAARAARAYNGSEESFLRLMTEGQRLDTFLDEKRGDVPRAAVEKDFAGHAGLRFQTLGDVLSTASGRFNRLVHGSSTVDAAENVLSRGGGVVLRHPLVFLPTRGAAPHTGSGAGWKAPEFQPRLALLLGELQKRGIYTDDIILHTGERAPGQIRQRPYRVVEIPRLDKQIAVCDQAGEVTLVSDTRLPLSLWAQSTKEALKTLPVVHDVSFGHLRTWFDNLWAYLQGTGTGVGTGVGRKLDVVAESRKPLQPRRFPLSEEFIVHHARVYQETHRGRTPTIRSGAVEGVEGETWAAWAADLEGGWRGLEGGSSLPKVFIKHGLVEAPALEKVCRWVEDHMKQNGGKVPNCGSGPIESYPSRTWAAIDRRLKDGACGFPKMKGGLRAFLIQQGYSSPPPVVGEDDVRRWARNYMDENGGVPPSVCSGPVKECPELTWNRISVRLREGSCGLPKRGGLSTFLRDAGLRAKKEPANPKSARPVCLSAEKQARAKAQDINEVLMWM